ncbi:MAG: hypothetical protein LDLANPLL_02840 [Turneriella sp.]|nr:hypothetical protein [Turneriella sp.]
MSLIRGADAFLGYTVILLTHTIHDCILKTASSEAL